MWNASENCGDSGEQGLMVDMNGRDEMNAAADGGDSAAPENEYGADGAGWLGNGASHQQLIISAKILP